MSGPLTGVRVVDLTTVVMGPFATQVLGDLGADVIKVEPPGGDPLRFNGPTHTPGMSALFLHTDRNKRSIVLDLKEATDRERLLELIDTADVFVHSNRAEAMTRLALGADVLAARNPRLVICAIAGFGPGGPYSGRPALDELIQALVGIPELQARVGGQPHYAPIFLARISSLFAVHAILAALIARDRSGRGSHVEVAMFETLAHLVLSDHLYGRTFEPPLSKPGYVRSLTPERRPYTTRDGYLCANIYNDTHWRRFCELVGASHLKTDPRFVDLAARTRNFSAVCELITARFAQRTTAEWLEVLNDADIPAMPLHTLDTLISDAHLRATGFLSRSQHPSEGTVLTPGIPTRWSESVPAVIRPAPELNAHADEVMREARHPAVRRVPSPTASSPRDASVPPLAGIRVIDLTSVVLGPYATLLMAELGADVIKVEPPKGDAFRYNGPARHRGMSGMFLNANRNKRSVVLDLKARHGREALLRMIETADVLVFNVRPQAMARLGLTYEAVAKANPRILYCSAVGYGQSGPYAAKPAYDELIQGAAALPSLEATIAGSPHYVPLLISDRTAGLTMMYAILGGLYRRQRTGTGQAIEVPMFETMAQMSLSDHLGAATYDPPLGEPGYQRALSAKRRPYKTRDGYLCVSTIQDRHWQRFCALAGRPELARDARFVEQAGRVRNSEALADEVAGILAGDGTSAWLSKLQAADIPVAESNTLEGLIADPHLAATNFIRDIDHPTEGRIHALRNPIHWHEPFDVHERPAPALGEHTAAVLREVGCSEAQIEGCLRDQAGAVATRA